MEMEMEKLEKRYCIHGKHVAIICTVVVVCSLAVGLGVGLNKSGSGTQPNEDTPTPSIPPVDYGPCQASSDTNGEWTNFRLPDYITPIHYDLNLEPDLDTYIYTGTVSIHLKVSKPTQYLWLHIRETFVSSSPKLQKNNGGSLHDVALNGCFQYKPQEYVVVEARELLPTTGPAEFYVLTLDFQGWLNGSLVGFYATTYQENGQTKKIAATDHEPTDARKSFPCFDEPNKKATFKISITHDSAYKALSNMPVEGRKELSRNKSKTSFQLSVPMSTYLVCFAVHQFEYVERISSRGVPLRIYVQPLQIHTAEYAANTTKKIFDYFETYFNMNYSISKLDKIAIPDFGTGAMENWGLITYRENNLLYDENESSSYNKQRVASVISHELVHQWFGNIVTMDWWDDLWLNEGFASFFEYVGVNEAEPTWNMRDIILINDVLPVMVNDAMLSSHPIIVNVSSPAEITSVFDSISYSKGASILRMLEDLMGQETFRDGCRKYLKHFHFQNAKTSDFWDSLQEVSGLPVADIMDTWTKQMGYPVLDLSMTAPLAKLAQKRFLLDPNADPSKPSVPLNYKWTIPVQWYSVGTNNSNTIIFEKEQTGKTQYSIICQMQSKSISFLLNKNHLGFYRVNHDSSIWVKISQHLLDNHLAFTAADRCGYIDDVFALGQADMVDYGSAFEVTKYLNREKQYIVWARVAASISYLQDMLMDDSTIYPKFQVGLLRETVQGIACSTEDQEALQKASDVFSQWVNGTSVAVNLRLLVYRYGMKNVKNEDSWNTMFDHYQKATLAQEKDKLLYGLASVENVSLLNRLLEAAKDEQVVRSQDVFTLIRYVSANKFGKNMAWIWVTLNWEYLVSRFTINDRNLGRLMTQITSTYNTDLQLWQMQQFFARYPEAGAGETPRKQALETVLNNIDWVKRNKAEIGQWLEKNVPY
uniref:Aminopeptidase n=1 Tax=Scleropages formosus TaxID=113540 RepID=A0A8C9RVT5_SCLFO